MNTIIIDEFYPDPRRDSGSIDILNYVEALHSLGHRVTLLTTATQEIAPKYDRGGEYTPLHIPSQAMEHWIIENANSIDLSIVARPGPASKWLPLLKTYAPKAPLIYLTVDLHFIRIEREALLLQDPGRMQSADWHRRIEIQSIREADLSVVVSSFEREYLNRVDSTLRVAYLPLFRRSTGTTRRYEDRAKNAVFIGGYQHGPNQDAAHYLVEKIHPLVQALDPSIELVLAGSNMPESIQRLSRRGVQTVGQIHDLGAFFDSARVSVAPLRFGAGQKGKVLSSLAHSLPVVCTSIAAEGMFDARPMGIRLADSPEATAKEIVQLCNDRKEWERMSSEAGAFSAGRDTARLPAALNELIERAQSHRAVSTRMLSAPNGINENPLVSILLMTRDSTSADQSVLRSWIDQTLHSRHTELIILNAGKPMAHDHGSCLIKEISGIEDIWARIDKGLALAKGAFVRFVSDDDPVLSGYIEQMEQQAGKLGRGSKTSVIGDFILLDNNSTSVCEQEYQNYPAGPEAYSKFINTFGSTPAYYSLFPTQVVAEWANFMVSNPVPFAYGDWLLHLLAFFSGRVCHPGRGVMLGHYKVQNWAGLATSEKSNLRIAASNGVPESCTPLMNLFWILDAASLLSSAINNQKSNSNDFVNTVARDQINRFIGNLEYRIKLINRITDMSYINQFNKLTKVIDAGELRVSSLRRAMHDFINAVEGQLPPALKRYFCDDAYVN